MKQKKEYSPSERDALGLTDWESHKAALNAALLQGAQRRREMRKRKAAEPPPAVGSPEWQWADGRSKAKRRRYWILRIGKTKVYLQWNGSTATHIDLAIPRAEFETQWYREGHHAWKR
jgi:hypothetical protein